MTMNEAQRALITAANQAAHAHNVFDVVGLAEFDASLLQSDHFDAECWARLTIGVLSDRCRSFTPAVLSNLVALCRTLDAMEAA